MPRRILLVTGKLAEPLVRKYGRGCDVFVAPVSVAAFLTPELIVRYLKKAGIKSEDYDFILIPGLVRGSAQIIEDELGIPAFKGPRNAMDLPQVLKALEEGFKLSKEVPADDLFSFDALKRVEDIRNRTKNKNYIEEALKKPWNALIGNLPAGRDFPARILAEVVDAPTLGVEKTVERALYYLREGADIIDIGMVAGERNLEFVDAIPEIREKLKEAGFEAPISFDSLNTSEIEGALDYADLFLSVDESNLEALVTEKPVVLIPTNQREGYFPTKPAERVKYLEKLKEKALDLGYKTIIPDLILEHVPHLARSVTAFQLYRERNPDDVLLAGVGNVVELYDADSVGMNALLAGIAKELSINLLLTTEVSAKAKGSVRELKRAVDMNLFDLPKDLGFDLLILKEKKEAEWRFEPANEVVEAQNRPVELEPVYFRIWVERGKIWVNAHKGTEAVLTIVGDEPNAIIDTVLERFEISPRHAFYLGRELERAYTALKLRRSYVQEVKLFREFYTE
ncbi:Pterin-binding protein [Thermococcus kodakarensis KOD1]|uniref:Pterin-binding protein n=1 Tax=Thermococcus kodakarensis (strain ATCC BAA-918 / JCM 12380 / KOD1) TaxID=69014 RepID=Q5JG13_THEKO|nr:dihydropteroate synthase-like protein [Thermococcus kodakarensis]WCN28396.1 dihydropteroate synthase-like protein [Thermococcus kodakarensis]WCN30692.1 dihydropteroate synthase-like protein [Thermococcus kodakarensis]BAD84508.1 Pterin-binding protein [Thermococcus kodakarensis KOD1]